jgi:(2S)-methylsuccinyl-CoA dehydrogenase
MDRRIEEALAAARNYESAARTRFANLLVRDGRVDPAMLETHQSAAHGFAWLAASVAALDGLAKWSDTLAAQGRGDARVPLMLRLGFGEYLARLAYGLPLAQNETLRPAEMGLAAEAAALAADPAVASFLAGDDLAASRAALVDLLDGSLAPDADEADETLAEMRSQLRRFAAAKIDPYAQGWHRDDAIIPLSVVEGLAELGVFGLCVPEE